MNTPAHAVLSLLVLARRPTHGKSAAIVAGALLPDAVIIVFYAWQLANGVAESDIWSVEYYRPLWQGWIDAFNSLPIVALAMLACWGLRRDLLLVFFASVMLHLFGDLPLHHDDAHRHFFPFSDWRFQSPVSYWDPAHHGRWASLVEFVLVVAASAFMYRRRPLLRAWAAALLAVYLGYLVYVLLFWY